MRRRGEKLESLPSTLLALDATSGRELWKTVRNDPPANLTTLHFMSLRTQDDWLAYSVEHDLIIAGKANQTFALNAKTGDTVWQKPIRGQQPLILGPETFINQTGHTYKIATGELVRRVGVVPSRRLQLCGWRKESPVPAIQLRNVRRRRQPEGIRHPQPAIRMQQQSRRGGTDF